MISIENQVQSGKLVCPLTHQKLIKQENSLATIDGRFSYPLVNGVPVLLDETQQKAYLQEEDGYMQQVYAGMNGKQKRPSMLYRLDKFADRNGDYRNEDSVKAFQAVAAAQGPDDIFLSIGGGPLRVHPQLINLNIDLFPNVDVVGDAYQLPYADNVVGGIYCEAVLEHLELPNEAVVEMFRVLKPGGQVFAATPFLQFFHAFPNHFQNFTLIGHQRLFERAGFDIVSSGVCVGPTYMIFDLLAWYMMYLPTKLLSQGMPRVIRILGSFLRPLDRRLNRHPQAHILGSTTYVHAIKKSSSS
jgi:SAM-dependent methyltransferase/uncharacterized protein YbaR (Trm112 family)